MDILGVFISLVLGAMIILYLKNIREIIIPAKKSKFEIAVVILSVIIIFFITYFLGNHWGHYLIGFLGIVLMLVTLPRRGITSKGFRSIRGINWGNWERLNSVRVTKDDDIKVYFTGRFTSYDYHYYDKNDYYEIISILEKNVSPEILEIE